MKLRWKPGGRDLGQSADADARSGEDVGAVLKLAADRIAEIVAASERAAGDIAEASRERLGPPGTGEDRISRERLVAELANSLVARADGLRAEANELADVLARASTRFASLAPSEHQASAKADGPDDVEPSAAETVAEAKDDGADSTAAIGETEPKPAEPDLKRRVTERFMRSPTPGSKVPFKRRGTSPAPPRVERTPSTDGLRLLATQMAVAGSTRAEIEARLHEEFGVEDPSSLFAGRDSSELKAREV